MQKFTFKKLSFLGLVLIAASAVTAAIFPTANSDTQTAFSFSHSYEDILTSTASCMPTVAATDDPCADDTVTGSDIGSGSTSYDNNSDGPTTTI